VKYPNVEFFKYKNTFLPMPNGTSEAIDNNGQQGDQIGRILAYWAIVYSEGFFYFRSKIRELFFPNVSVQFF
jgi:hypothetical protein